MANINSVITYNANLSPAQAQIRALTGQIAGLTAAFNNLNKTATTTQRRLTTAFAGDVGNIGGFTAQMVSAHNAVENFGKQLVANRLTMREYFREAVAGYTRQNSLMKQLAEQQVRYQQSVAVPTGGGQMMMLTPQTLAATGTSAALAAERFSIFNKLVDGGATSMLNWGKNTQWAGRQLMVGFTVPLAMFTALASKQFRDLDKELTRFQKVYGSDLGGAVSEATDRMRENVKQLAFDISRTYGIAAKDTAALAADIAATGQEGQALLESVQQTTRLAVLGEVDRQEAMKATLSLQSAFRLNTNELAESINFLNAVENQTSATLEDLATAIPKVGPIVRSLGGDVRDLATLLVAMREGGIPAAEAANALKSGLAALINPTKQASEVAKKFGVDLVGIVDANRGQLMPTLYEFQNALSNLDSFSRSKIIEQIFGKYQFARISALFDNLGRLGSQTQAVVELAAKSSSELAATANQEIRVLTESTAVRFQRTLEELKNAIMPIGQTLTETLIPILSFIGEGIKTFSGFFQSLPGPIKDFAKLGVAIAALAGPVIMLVGLFGNLIANGIKFGMMVTRLGARMMGLKVQPFELLNAELMAAKFGVDNLTTAFTNQETAMNRLVGVMTRYADSLVRLRAASPELFVPGVLPATGGRTPVRRQKGGPIPGYGGGDIVPAYLEPGEFVITKEATRENRAFLEAINSGKESGRYEKGRSSAYGSGQGSISRPAKLHTVDPRTLHQMFYGKEGMLAAIGYGGMTSTVHPQSINGTFEALRQAGVRMPQWMASGIPFNDSAVGQMIEVLERERSAGTVKVGRQYLHALAYLKRLEKTPGLARYRTLMGYALTTASSERMTGIISNSDSAQKKRIQQLYAYLNQKVSSGATPAQIFRTINNESIKYLDAATTGKLLPGMSRKDTGINLQKAGNLFAVSESSSNMQVFKDNLRRQLPKGAQTTTLWQQLLFGRYRRMQTGGVSQGEPALLEPGEFIVNSEASRKNANILHAMNKGTIKGYQFGRSQNLPGETTLPSGLVVPGSAAPAAAEAAGETVKAHLNRPITVPASSLLGLQGLSDSARASLLAITANGDVLVRVFSNLVVALQKTTNSALNTGNAMASTVSAELKSAAAWEIITRNTGLTMQDLQPTILRVTEQLDNLGNELIDDPRLYQIIETELTQLAAAGDRAAIVLQTLGSQYGAMADPNDPRKHRMDLGAGVAPSYRTERTGTGTPVHMLPYVDLRRYEVDERGGRVALPMADAAVTGPGRAMQDPMQKAMRGQNLMNVAFMVPMLVSSFAMAGAASEDLAAKLSMLSMVIMGLSMIPMLRGMGGAVKGVGTNFLGLGSLGEKLTAAGTARQAAVPVSAASKYAASSSLGRAFAGMPHMAPTAIAAAQASKAGSGLLMAGRIASLAGGPIGIAAGLGITAAITGFMMYRNAAEEARERAIAAFNDPVKSAEYFGETLLNVSDIIEQNRLSNISKDLEDVDQALRDVVKQDYAPLIEQIKYLSAGAGAQALSTAYSNMIVSGMSAENAKATIEAIATEAGMRGGEAFTKALEQGLLNNQNIGQALDNIIGQFNPAETKFGKSGISLLETLQNELASLEQKRLDLIESRPVPVPGGRGAGVNPLTGYDASATQQELDDIGRSIDAVKDRIEDLLTINPQMISSIMDALVMAYAQDPTAAIEGFKNFVATIKELQIDDQLAAMQEIENFLASGYGEEWELLGKTVNEHNEQIAAAQMLIEGISLEHAINQAGEFDLALANAAISAKLLADQTERAADALQSDLQEKILTDLDKTKIGVETEIREIDDATTKIIKSYNKRRREYQETFEVEQEGRQDSIDGLQDEMDARREIFNEEMDQLDKKSDAIEKSSEAYIKSLQKNQKADSFYAQQRKTSLSALEKLASGDVFGFLQEREQMSADAQQFSYDETIASIEERRDLELEVIDETRKKRQEEQEDYENMMSDRIEAIQDQMDAEQELYDDKMVFFDKEIKKAERVRDKRIGAKREELDVINNMIETANADILDFQKKFAKEFEQYDQYAIQLENLKILKVQEIYYRGGATLWAAAAQAGIAFNEISDFIKKNAGQFSFVQNPGTSFARSVIPTGTTYYKGMTTALPDTEDVIRSVQSMTVDAQSVTLNGDINLPFGSDPNDLDGDGTPNSRDPEPSNPTVFATGGYINNGKVKVQRFDNGGGGKVTGPGGPKSDVIPALLSNGEYVIQASSVGKYGKDMMDNINAGKFAYGGYISADRAERTGERVNTSRSPKSYYGSTVGSPKKEGSKRWDTMQSLLGGIGENQAQQRAKLFAALSRSNVDLTNFYTWSALNARQKQSIFQSPYNQYINPIGPEFYQPPTSPIPLRYGRQAELALGSEYNRAGAGITPVSKPYTPYTRGNVSQYTSGGNAGAGFGLMWQGLTSSISQQGIGTTLGAMVEAIEEDPKSLIPFYGLSTMDTSTQEGKDLLSAAALMEIAGVIPGFGAAFKGLSTLGKSAIKSGMRTATSSTFKASGDALTDIPYSGGRSLVVETGGRPVTFANINGKKVPFYISTGMGRKEGVATGKWYPYFGHGPKGWFNKGSSEAEINSYYGSTQLKEMAEWLDINVGDIRGTDIPTVSALNINEALGQKVVLSIEELSKVRAEYLAKISGGPSRIKRISSSLSDAFSRLRTEDRGSIRLPFGGALRQSSRNVSRELFEKDKIDLERLTGQKATDISSQDSTSILYQKRTEELLNKYPELDKNSPDFVKTLLKEYYPFVNENDTITLYKGLADERKLGNLLNWTGNKNSFGSYFSANPLVAEIFGTSLGSPGKMASIQVPIKDFIESSYVRGLPFYNSPTKGWPEEMASIIDYLNIPDSVKNTLKITDLDYYQSSKTGLTRRGQPVGNTNEIFNLLDEFYPQTQAGRSTNRGALAAIGSTTTAPFLGGWAGGLDALVSAAASPGGLAALAITAASLSPLGRRILTMPYHAVRNKGIMNNMIHLNTNPSLGNSPLNAMHPRDVPVIKGRSSGPGLYASDRRNTRASDMFRGASIHNPSGIEDWYSIAPGPRERTRLRWGWDRWASKEFYADKLKDKSWSSRQVQKLRKRGIVGLHERGYTTLFDYGIGNKWQARSIPPPSSSSRLKRKSTPRVIAELALQAELLGLPLQAYLALAGLGLFADGGPVGKYANGGLIKKYADGGLVFNTKQLNNLGHSLNTAKNVEKYLDAGGWPIEKQKLAWTIAMRESGGNPGLYHDNTNDPAHYSPGNGDYGLFQVNRKGYGNQPWFNIQKLLDGIYNSSVAYKYISRGGKSYLPWALRSDYNGTSAGFDWSDYGGRPSWGLETEKNTNDLWKSIIGYTSVTPPSNRSKDTGKNKSQQVIPTLYDSRGKTNFGEAYPSYIFSQLGQKLNQPVNQPVNQTTNITDGTVSPTNVSPTSTGPAIPSIDATNLMNAMRKWIPANRLSFYPGWQSFGKGTVPAGILMHHTSGVGPGVLEWVARGGRVEYGSPPGPVVQAMISRNGTAHILAGGASLGWGSGEGSTSAFSKEFPGLAQDIEEMGGASNSLWQIEVESAGLSQDFTPAQFDSIARMSAAVKDFAGWPSFNGKIINHKDWAPGRKPDTLYDKQVFIDNAYRMLDSGREYARGGFVSKIKSFATGGPVFGPGGPRSDMIPAMLSNGEYVIKAASVQKYGKGLLDKINAGQLPNNIQPVPLGVGGPINRMKFADGGFVGTNMGGGAGTLTMSAPQSYSTPMYSMPNTNKISMNQIKNMIQKNITQGGDSINNPTNVKIVINGAGQRSTKSIANQVAKMIQQSNARRDHGRSAG